MLTHKLKTISHSDADVGARFQVYGFHITDGTTPSTQATGAGNLAVRANVGEGYVVIDGHYREQFQPIIDNNIAAAYAAGLVAGGARYLSIAVVAWLNRLTGTINIGTFKGSPSTTVLGGMASMATILGVIGTDNPAIVLGDINMDRTGDTTVTQSVTYTRRIGSLWDGIVYNATPFADTSFTEMN